MDHEELVTITETAEAPLSDRPGDEPAEEAEAEVPAAEEQTADSQEEPEAEPEAETEAPAAAEPDPWSERPEPDYPDQLLEEAGEIWAPEELETLREQLAALEYDSPGERLIVDAIERITARIDEKLGALNSFIDEARVERIETMAERIVASASVAQAELRRLGVTNADARDLLSRLERGGSQAYAALKGIPLERLKIDDKTMIDMARLVYRDELMNAKPRQDNPAKTPPSSAHGTSHTPNAKQTYDEMIERDLAAARSRKA